MNGGGGGVSAVMQAVEVLVDRLLDVLLQLLWRWAAWPGPVRGLPLW